MRFFLLLFMVLSVTKGFFGPARPPAVDGYQDLETHLKWLMDPSLRKLRFKPDQEAKIQAFWNT